MSHGDDAEVEHFITEVDEFFDCIKNEIGDGNSAQLDEKFKNFQTAIENLISSQTPAEQL